MLDEKDVYLRGPMSSSLYLSSASKRSIVTTFVLIILALWVFVRAGPTPSMQSKWSEYDTLKEASKGEKAGKTVDPDEYHFSSFFHDFEDIYEKKSNYTATLVIGRLQSEKAKTQWAYQVNNIDRHAMYIVDDTTAEFHLNRNHGRESMVYLQYILDHYDNLTDITFFFHSQEKTWHNNILLSESSVETMNRMRREWIMQQGYVNVRCDHWPGCPAWVTYNPTNAEFALDPHHGSDMFSPKLKEMLWPDEPIEHFPRYFAQPCCSQFAASADAIRAHPKSTYEALYKWIDEEWLDQWSGRAMEMIWQYVFLRRGVVCPNMIECYCKVFGVLCSASKEDINLIETWNMFRSRGEELQWQQEFRGKEIRKEKGGEHIPWEEQKDGEYDRITKEREDIRQLSQGYKKEVIRKFGAQDSAVDW